jgi:hypothetical protein
MSELDRIIDNDKNLNAAKRAVLESRITEAVKQTFSSEDWKAMGFTDLDVAIDINSSNKDLATFRLNGEAILQGTKRNFSIQYDVDFRTIDGFSQDIGFLNCSGASQRIVIPLSPESDIKDIQAKNSKALLEVIRALAV